MFVDAKREVEVAVVSTDNIYIDCTSEIATKPLPFKYGTKFRSSKLENQPPPFKITTKPPPGSMVLTKSVNTSSFCHSVCHYKGVTYVGTQNGTIVAIDSQYNSKALVVLGSGDWPYGLIIHENKMYVLVSNKCGGGTISVYNLSGQFILQWDRKDICHYIRPAIVSNQIVVPDTDSKQLTVYSLSGKVIKHIPYPQFKSGVWGRSSICTADNNSIIVSTMDSSQVSKINIATGEAVWTCKDIVEPQAVAIYGNDYVCVGGEGKISFLNINTGLILCLNTFFATGVRNR